MEKINVAIIGCGRMGNRHAKFYKQNKNVNIHGFYDSNQKLAIDLANKFHSKYFLDIDSIMNDVNIDAISICTPNALHYDLLVKGIKKNKHILVEKPIVTTLKECQNLEKIMKKVTTKIMVGHTHRFYPCNIALKSLLKSGKIGIPKVLNCFEYIPGRNPTDKMPTWIKNSEISGGGVLMTDFVHTIDKLSWILESKIKKVYAPFISNFISGKNVEDVAIVNLWFENGSVATCVTGCPSPGGIDSNIRVIGKKGEIQMEFAGKLNLLTTKKSSKKYKHQEEYQKHSDYAFKLEIDEFVKAIIYNLKPKITYMDGINTIKTVFAIYKSNEKNIPIELKI
jgi:UDP-N-acetylglucosamine 3-dehydrogenase